MCVKLFINYSGNIFFIKMVNYGEEFFFKFVFSFISIYFILDSCIIIMYVIFEDYPLVLEINW